MNAAPNPSGESGLARLFDELCMKLQAGQAVDLAAYLGKHPEQSEELSELLPAVQLLFDLRAAEEPASAGRVEPEIGVLGDFRLIREIGHGGMGVVYEAEQMSLGRCVASKILPFASVLKPTQLQRFQNEIHIAATLDHPNIVRVFAVGCDRGVHHFAMQLIEGQSLAEVINQLRGLTSMSALPRGGEGTNGTHFDTTRIAGRTSRQPDQPTTKLSISGRLRNWASRRRQRCSTLTRSGSCTATSNLRI